MTAPYGTPNPAGRRRFPLPPAVGYDTPPKGDGGAPGGDGRVKYGRIAGVDKPVSRLVQGTTMINSENEAEGFALLDAVLDMGCNTFDTAHVYGAGDNERTVGRWVNSRGVRDRVVVIGKGAHHNADRRRVTPFDIAADIHDSLARFQFDYIDLYLLHRDDPGVPVGPIVEALNEHHRAGRIRAFGGSNWSAARIREANEYARSRGLVPFAATSPHFSLAEMLEEPWEGCISIAGPQGKDSRDQYLDWRMPVFAWSSLSGGFFSGRLTRENLDEHVETLYHRCYVSEDNLQRLERARELAAAKGVSVPQIALAYVLTDPLDVYPLVASFTPDEFRANLAALDLELTPKERAWLDLRDSE